MDLEISLRVSTFACRADISQRQKTGGPPFSSPDLFLVSVRELILGIPAFYGLASSICIQQFTNMPEGHRNSRWG